MPGWSPAESGLLRFPPNAMSRFANPLAVPENGMRSCRLLAFASLLAGLAWSSARGQSEPNPDYVSPTVSPADAVLRDHHLFHRRDLDDICQADTPRDDFYHPWSWSVTYLTGYVGIILGPLDTPFSMVPEIVRLNCVWTSPHPNRILRGSWEGILELDTMPVVNGPASIVIGGSLLLRYNYATHTCHRLVPYFQIGGGGMYTDAYLHRSPVLSSGFEFIVQAGVGANLFLTRRLALTAEWDYYHFSNGGIVLPNVSVNTMGGLVGFTYYFGRH